MRPHGGLLCALFDVAVPPPPEQPCALLCHPCGKQPRARLTGGLPILAGRGHRRSQECRVPGHGGLGVGTRPKCRPPPPQPIARAGLRVRTATRGVCTGTRSPRPSRPSRLPQHSSLTWLCTTASCWLWGATLRRCRSVLSGDTTGLEGEQRALALVAQRSRKMRPVPLHDQVTRALRMNKKVHAGLREEDEDDGAAIVASPK
jgi:hypothetical protein